MPDAPSSANRRRRWLARLIVFFGAALLGLFAAELCARVLWRKETIIFPRYHTDATYGAYRLRRLRPNTTFQHTSADGTWLFRTNAQGFRDTRDWHYERTPGVLRILVLGDSHTQGFECAQDATYSARLEQRLAGLGIRSEVLNCGVSGLGTAEQLAFFENEGARYRPDFVVLGWFANDPDDNVKSGLFSLRDGKLTAEKYEHLPGVNVLNSINGWVILRWLSEHSYFYSLLFNRVWEWRKGLLSQRTNAAVEYAGKPPAEAGAESSYPIELSAALLARLHASCRQAGARLIIADIPSYLDPQKAESSVPVPLLDRLRTGSEAYLPSKEWLAPAPPQTDYFARHGQHHISPAAHDLLAAALAAQVSADSAQRH